MEKYNIGDKFVIEIEAKGGAICLASGNINVTERQLDMLERLDSDYINEHYGDLQDEAYDTGVKEAFEAAKKDEEKAYAKGLADAWGLSKKLWYTPHEKIVEIFSRNYPIDVLESFTPQDVLGKFETYEKEKKLKVGDIIETSDNERVCVIRVSGDRFIGVMADGRICPERLRCDWVKTGEHIDMASILAQIGGAKKDA